MNINPESGLIALNSLLMKLRKLDNDYVSERRNIKDAIDQHLMDVVPRFFRDELV